MGFLKSFKQRCNGSFRYKNRILAARAKKEIVEGIHNGIFPLEKANEYLASIMQKILKPRIKHAKLAFFIGGKNAEKILFGSKKWDLTNEEEYECIEKAFMKNHLLRLGAIQLLPAEREMDKFLIVHVFWDVLAERMLQKSSSALVDYFSEEGSYENEGVRLEKGDCVLDCGANMGFFSALASSLGCKVIAFEPSEFIRTTYLNENARLNGNIAVAPFALSDVNESLEFFVDEENLGGSKFADSVAGGREAKQTETVNAIRLDDYIAENNIEKVDFIKADIEGAERKMLLGARETIKKWGPKLSICTYHLPDDPEVLTRIIKEIQPKYTITHGSHKLFAHL